MTDTIYQAEIIEGKAVFRVPIDKRLINIIPKLFDADDPDIFEQLIIKQLNVCPLKTGDRVTVEILLGDLDLTYPFSDDGESIDYFRTIKKIATITNIKIDPDKMDYIITGELK